MNISDLAQPEAWQEFQTHGILLISHVLDPRTVMRLRAEAYHVFHHSDVIPRHAYRADGKNGFTPQGVEGVAGRIADAPRQFWDLRLHRADNESTDGASQELLHHMRSLSEELASTMRYIFTQMERGLGPHASGLHNVMYRGDHDLRAAHYPQCPEPPENGVLFPAHRDFSLVTVFIGGSEPGLQIERNGAWIDLDIPFGSIAIAAGGMLRYWTGGPKHQGRIGGLRHRVMHAARERLSLMYFTEPEPSTVLPHADGLTAGEYISRFVAATRATS